MLQDLQKVIAQSSLRIDSFRDSMACDCQLPEEFKAEVRGIESASITYTQYGFIVLSSGLNIYFSNQLWYYAAACVDIYNAILEYDTIVKNIIKIDQEKAKKCKDDVVYTESIIPSSIVSSDRDYLVKYLSDYSWWNGGKSIERGDFYYSPIVSTCKLVNASQSFVAEMCKFLAKNTKALNLLLLEIPKLPRLEKKTLFCSSSVSSFMAECLKVFLKYDPDFYHAKNSFKQNSVTIGFAGCNFGKLKSAQDVITDPRRINDCDKNICWNIAGTEYYFLKEQTTSGLTVFIDGFNTIYRNKFIIVTSMGGTGAKYCLLEILHPSTGRTATMSTTGMPLQQIWYGAPGTGKSHEIKEQTAGKAMVRTTFHPDSDYSTFVGAYKPVMDEVDVKVTPVVTTGGVSFSPASDMKEKRISYRFVKQAFMKAYLGAWKKYADNPQSPEPQYLVIEEINRGNCAQIFGDIFQLLDRSGNGFSDYPIEADEDLRQEIARSFAEEDDYKLSAALAVNGVVEDYTSNYGATLSEDIQEGRVMLLPSNLYIWATMNTSDQSLFPIDSAFKRRWEWKYMPIKDCGEGYKIVLSNGKEYDWFEFITEMNKLIAEKTTSEDKQMGYFFIKAENGKITADRFVNKVLFYLYNDVFKSYDLPTEFGNKKFTAFFTDTDTKVEELMKDLGLKALGETDTAETTEDTAE